MGREKGKCPNCERPDMYIGSSKLCGYCESKARNKTGEARKAVLALAREDVMQGRVRGAGRTGPRPKQENAGLRSEVKTVFGAMLTKVQRSAEEHAPQQQHAKKIVIYFLRKNLSLYDQIEKRATENMRDINKEALWILKQYIKNEMLSTLIDPEKERLADEIAKERGRPGTKNMTAKYDANYEARRNDLIPQAEKYANMLAGPTAPFEEEMRHEWALKWNTAFHGKMNELAESLK